VARAGPGARHAAVHSASNSTSADNASRLNVVCVTWVRCLVEKKDHRIEPATLIQRRDCMQRATLVQTGKGATRSFTSL